VFTDEPDLILIISGKRKSGKDYVTQKLVNYLELNSQAFEYSVLTLSEPLKQIYAAEHQLDLKELLSSSEYKEKYRLDMINWSDTKRKEDAHFFCKLAVAQLNSKRKKCLSNKNKKFYIWIVSDARRLSDLSYFKKYHKNF
jgi:phosphomevalonate kinase